MKNIMYIVKPQRDNFPVAHGLVGKIRNSQHPKKSKFKRETKHIEKNSEKSEYEVGSDKNAISWEEKKG